MQASWATYARGISGVANVVTFLLDAEWPEEDLMQQGVDHVIVAAHSHVGVTLIRQRSDPFPAISIGIDGDSPR
jgi:hypothetical protein